MPVKWKKPSNPDAIQQVNPLLCISCPLIKIITSSVLGESLSTFYANHKIEEPPVPAIQVTDVLC